MKVKTGIDYNKAMAKSDIFDGEHIIWSMTDAEFATLNPYFRGEVAFNDLPPAVKKYVEIQRMKPSSVDVAVKNSAKSK